MLLLECYERLSESTKIRGGSHGYYCFAQEYVPSCWDHHLVMCRLYLSLGVKGTKLMMDTGLQLMTQ